MIGLQPYSVRLCSELGGYRWQAISREAAGLRHGRYRNAHGKAVSCALLRRSIIMWQSVSPARSESVQSTARRCNAKSFRIASRNPGANYRAGVYYLAICRAAGHAKLIPVRGNKSRADNLQRERASRKQTQGRPLAEDGRSRYRYKEPSTHTQREPREPNGSP
jgi:hypothetical protein